MCLRLNVVLAILVAFKQEHPSNSVICHLTIASDVNAIQEGAAMPRLLPVATTRR
jgi:hypothetical protein